MQSKLSQNPHYGQPSARKLRERLAGAMAWARGMAMLRAIKEEEKDKLTLLRDADSRMDVKWST